MEEERGGPKLANVRNEKRAKPIFQAQLTGCEIKPLNR
jgi:hypothetical protein